MRTVCVLLLLVLLLCLVLDDCLAGRNFYKILDVKKNAKADDIRRAYRKLALKYHPDKNVGNAKVAQLFLDVSAAYDVLNDPQKRKVYDRAGIAKGEEAVKEYEKTGQTTAATHNPLDIFAQFFGQQRASNEPPRSADVVIELPVTLAQLYTGFNTEFLVRQQQLCSHCSGSGAETEVDIASCPHCHGRGFQVEMQQIAPGFVTQSQVTCRACQGTGKIIKKLCHVCGGKKLMTGVKTLDLEIEAGMGSTAENSEIVFENSADDSLETASGHIIIKLKPLSDPVFQRRVHDLHSTLQLSLVESLTGFQRQITHLDGRVVDLSASRRVTPHSFTRRLVGDGMPHWQTPSDKGDLYVHYTVRLPSYLTDKQRQGFAKLFLS